MANKKVETMKSRERVTKAINHQPIDRMPIDLGGNTATSISAFAYYNLREYLGFKNEDIEITDMVQFTPRIHEDILKRFHCDCKLLQPKWSGVHNFNPRGKYNFIIPKTANPILNENGDWHIEFNGRMRMLKNGFFWDGNWLNFEERNEDKVIKITAIEAERLYKETDYYVIYKKFGAFFHEGDIEWQCKMLTDPDEILEENEAALESQLRKVGKVINSMGKYIQCIGIGSDLGTQNGPAVNPKVYEELCAPFLKKFCSFIHENSNLKIFMHNCGSIKPFIPILIDCGVDILNPVQVSANNMDPQDLKDSFGDKITFWGGGCDTQNILNNCSPKEVANNVRMLTKIFKQNQGFVFNQVHNIMGDIKPENIVAMFDTAYDESFY